MSNINLTVRPAQPKADLVSQNPALLQYEVMFESETGLGKLNLGSAPAHWNDLPYLNSGGVKKYVALLTQTGTNAPVATVLENTLGGPVVWTRTYQGGYYGTLAGAFTSGKTSVVVSGGSTPDVPLYSAYWDDADKIFIGTTLCVFPDPPGQFLDDVLAGTTVIITVST